MSATWNVIFRQVALRANQLATDNATSLATSYAVATIGQTQLADRAIEFPKLAIDDAIVDSCERIVSVIGSNLTSPYRRYFTANTIDTEDGQLKGGHTTGELISTLSGHILNTTCSVASSASTVTAPIAMFEPRHTGRKVTAYDGSTTVTTAISRVNSTTSIDMCTTFPNMVSAGLTLSLVSTPIIGSASRWFDKADNVELKPKPIEEIRRINQMSDQIASYDNVYYYHYDGERIWHTRPTNKVYGEFVVWDSSAARISLDASNLIDGAASRGRCPFPDDLHEVIICGALRNIFRGNFNIEQVQVWSRYFEESLQRIAAGFTPYQDTGSDQPAP